MLHKSLKAQKSKRASSARAAFLKAVQSVSDLVGGVTAPSIFKGAKGISEGVQVGCLLDLATLAGGVSGKTAPPSRTGKPVPSLCRPGRSGHAETPPPRLPSLESITSEQGHVVPALGAFMQTSSNMGLAAAKSPGYSSSALWETLRAGLNIALIPVLEPGRAFKDLWNVEVCD
eukprot:1158271-Pelagomonas_calceolata.AAC.4